jgi:hypothetical protein
MLWIRLKEFQELDRLVREDPDRARLFDREGPFDSPVPWWQDNHRGLAGRLKFLEGSLRYVLALR